MLRAFRQFAAALLLALYVTCAGADIYINDNGVWVRQKYLHINDNGVWRSIKYAYINDNGTWRVVFRRVHEFTITADTNIGPPPWSGFWIGGPWGSITNGTLDDGPVIFTVECAQPGPRLRITLHGFSADPGQSYIKALVVGSTSYASSSATYAYGPYLGGGNAATWEWSTCTPFSQGVTYSLRLEF